MNTSTARPHAARALRTLLGGCLFAPSLVLAASGTWSGTSGGNWSDTNKWTGGVVASGGGTGTNVIATFSVAGTQTINLDTAETVQSLVFSTGAYTLSSTNASVLTLAGSSIPVIASNGTISATIAGSQGFNMNPGGVRSLVLSGNNTYTGSTTLSGGGMIYVKSNNALGATGSGNGTTVNYTTGSAVQLHFQNSVTSGEDITLQIGSSGTTGANLIYNDSGNNTLTGNITLGRYSPNSSLTSGVDTFGLQSTAGIMTISGNITGATANGQADGSVADQNRLQLRPTAATATINLTGVISDGTIGTGGLSLYTTADSGGIVRLTGANTYTGSTVHQHGTLLINNTSGSGSGTGAVSVASGATLGGTGTLAPTGSNGISFVSGSILAPGDLDNTGAAIAAGKSLTFNLGSTTGSATFASGSTFSIDLNAGAATSAQVPESISFIGLSSGVARVAFNDNIVNFSVTGGLLADGVYTLVSLDAANAYSGQLVLGTGLEAYTDARLVYNAGSIQLAIGSIPEPATTGMIFGAFILGVGVVFKRRKR